MSTGVASSANRFYPLYLYEANRLGANCLFKEARASLLATKSKWPRDCFEYCNYEVSMTWITQEEDDRHAALQSLQEADKTAKAFLRDPAKIMELTKAMNNTDAPSAELVWNWTIDTRVCYAEGLFAKSLLQLQLGSFVKGAYNLRKSFKHLQSVQKELAAQKALPNGHRVHPEIDHLLKANLGIFYFFASFAPGMFLKVLELLGFVADRDLGIQYLTEAADGESIRSTLASMFLLLNYVVIPRGLTKSEDNLAAAHHILDHSLSRFPTNAPFKMMSGTVALKESDVTAAIKYYKEAIDGLKELQRVPFPYYFGLAVCHYVGCDWQAAADVLCTIVDSPPERKFDMKGFAALQLATCYFMLGNEKRFKEVVDKLPSVVAKNSRFDKLAEKKLAHYKKRGFGLAPFEMMYVRRDLHHTNSELAQKLLDQLDKNYSKMTESPENRASYMLCKSVLVHQIGNAAEAKTLLRTVIASEKQVKDETWVFPNSCQELGEILYWEGNMDEAEELFKKASKYSGFDWEDVVRNRIKMSLETIKKMKKDGKQPSKHEPHAAADQPKTEDAPLLAAQPTNGTGVDESDDEPEPEEPVVTDENAKTLD